MITVVLYIAALWMVGQGILMLLGKYTPATARAAIDEPAVRRLWCRENGFISFGWAAVFALYGTSGMIQNRAINITILVITILGALACMVLSYRSNRKYFKDPEKR